MVCLFSFCTPQQQGQPPPALRRTSQQILARQASNRRRIKLSRTTGRSCRTEVVSAGRVGGRHRCRRDHQWNGHYDGQNRCSLIVEGGASPSSSLSSSSSQPFLRSGSRLRGNSDPHCSLSALCTACATPSLGHGPPLVRK